MTGRPKQICTYPGCTATQIEPRCAKHPYQRPIDTRPSARERGYDKTWERLRLMYLMENPVCEIQVHCDGAPATEVDHIVPISKGGERLDPDNLQSTCSPCHKWKTATIDRRK